MEEQEKELSWFLKLAAWTEYELADLCLGVIPDRRRGDYDERNEVLEFIHRAAEMGELPRQTNSLQPLNLHQYRTETFYRRSDATRWAAANFPETFPFMPESGGATGQEELPGYSTPLLNAAGGYPIESEGLQIGGGTKWPWGNYETELLRKLAMAADRFWKLYDPIDNTTAPTNQQVIEWLKQQEVADRTAEVMATILRADGLPTGPRK